MWSRLVDLLDSYKVVRISIVGLEQTGKTNNAMYIANLFEQLALKRGSAPVILYERWKDPATSMKKLEKLRKIRNDWCQEYGCADYCPDALMIIFDDISFITYRLDREMKKFMHYMSKIAHKHRWARRIVITNIFHYSKATLPFIRISHVRILTSLSCPAEVEGLKQFFTESSLWNFYRLKTENLRKTKYYALYNIMGAEFITKPPKAHTPQFLTTVRLHSKDKTAKRYYNIVLYKTKGIPIHVQRRQKHIDIYYKQNGQYIRILKLVQVQG